jgi:hypothetical protein
MRASVALFTVILAASAQAHAQAAPGCTTGLCLQQVSCPGGGTTSISGTVYAPNGTDPLPDVLVYIPNATVPAFTPGVSCDVVGAPPPGSPLVGTVTAVDGTFTITNVPVGASIPIVVQTGRWRRQAVVDTTIAGACANTAVASDSVRMPRNQTEGDIPRIAIATGGSDQVECVLRKVGIDDSEFTDSNGTGRIVLYPGSASPGAKYPDTSSAQTESDLMGTAANLNAYDMLMLPCEGTAGRAFKTAQELDNLQDFANIGGRVYASHYSYTWLDQRFNGVARWTTNPPNGNSTIVLNDGIATVDTSFSAGNTLGQWLQLPAINASVAPDEMQIYTLKKDTNGVIAPTQSWLTLNDPADGNPVMQFVFNTPIGSTGNQCGRVLFNEYHVENASSTGTTFPAECSASTMTPQEKLLEYSLFELTADGSSATLTPATQDFGSETVGFPSATQTFTWTNNSTFVASVTLLTASGDFSVGTNTCTSVASGGSCSIIVTFTPTALGARTGMLTVGSPGSTLTSSLIGTGTPGYTISTSSLTFSSVDVGSSASQTFTVTSIAPGSLPVPSLVTTGDYSASTDCPSTVPAGSSCHITVTFSPTATGTRPGSLSVNSGVVSLPVSLTGNGVDFTIAVNPASANVIAGYSVSTTVTTTPVAGFNAPITLSCTTTASASGCTIGVATFVLNEATNSTITITTTSKYAVIGYGGLGGGSLWLIAVGSGLLLWTVRRSTARFGVIMILLAGALSLTGCAGKLPAQNSSYTAPGAATYTLTATDGTITHSVTYTLNVSAK